MIREGIVKRVDGEMLEVCFERPEACEKCGACAGHGHTHMTRIRGNAKPGDRVAVDMPDAKVFRISAIVYLVPLAFMLLGLLIGSFVFKNDVIAAALGVALLAVSYLVLHQVDRKLGKKSDYTPQLIAVVPAEQTAGEPESAEEEK